MATEPLTTQGSERAHDIVDKLESTLSDVEGTVRGVSAQATEHAEALSREAQTKAAETLSNIEQYVREKPVQAIGIAFAAGILTSVLLRKS